MDLDPGVVVEHLGYTLSERTSPLAMDDAEFCEVLENRIVQRARQFDLHFVYAQASQIYFQPRLASTWRAPSSRADLRLWRSVDDLQFGHRNLESNRPSLHHRAPGTQLDHRTQCSGRPDPHSVAHLDVDRAPRTSGLRTGLPVSVCRLLYTPTSLTRAFLEVRALLERSPQLRNRGLDLGARL